MMTTWWRRSGAIAVIVLGVLCLATRSASAESDAQAATAPALDSDTAQWLATLPLACVGKPHAPPRSRGYLYQTTATIKPDFAKTRAFYGCYDWHSSVNSMWAMTKLLRQYPAMPIARLIREKLNEHLSADAIAGEVAFFNEEGNQSFERPYGWAWLLRLYGETRSWDDPDAKKWAANLEPLAKLFLVRIPPYLNTLAAPMRVGTHGNTAYSLKMLLEYARGSGEPALEAALVDRAKTFFLADQGCAPNVEVSGSDFLSACLSEAALMADVLQQAQFVTWLDAFLPAPDSPSFSGLAVGVIAMPQSNEELEKANMLGAKSHLIGLAASRARSLEDLAAALPAGDARVRTYRALAASNAVRSIAAMYDADYAGSHWIATFITDYLVSAHRATTSAEAR